MLPQHHLTTTKSNGRIIMHAKLIKGALAKVKELATLKRAQEVTAGASSTSAAPKSTRGGSAGSSGPLC
jgi:hypothetical protein